MINVGDFVNVSLSGGGVITDAEVIDKPINNQIYWTIESAGVTYVVGPSLVSMEKL